MAQPHKPLSVVPKLLPLERQLAQIFVRDRVFEKKLAVAFSGGRDSAVLLAAIHRLCLQFRCSVLAIHIEHKTSGPWGGSRKRAASVAKTFCDDLSIPLFHAEAVAETDSEEDLRRARYLALQGLREKANYDLLLTAHHQDDLLETRLLRLLRGTGPLGLQAIRAKRGVLWRPLLESDSKSIGEYAVSRKLAWHEDSSNKDVQYMRNWVRHVWLETLDRDHPQARAVLARSLQAMADRLDSEKSAYIRRLRFSSSTNQQVNWGLSLEALALPHSKILDQLALFCHTVGLSSYTQSHLEEILKRLRSHDGFQTCQILGASWSIERGFLRVSVQSARS